MRRICLLREQGDAVAAARLAENDLATAVRDLRLAEGVEAVTEAELQAMFVNEERRVADAVVLAELLMPQLAASAASASARAGPVPVYSVLSCEESVASERRAESGTGSPAIPDLLDAMFAADRAVRRR